MEENDVINIEDEAVDNVVIVVDVKACSSTNTWLLITGKWLSFSVIYIQIIISGIDMQPTAMLMFSLWNFTGGSIILSFSNNFIS